MPKKYIPVDPETFSREIQLEFQGAYQELKLRRFTADLLKDANKLRSRVSNPKTEWENLFIRRPCN